MDDTNRIGEQIKTIRKQQNLTQKELGQLCGMSDSQVRNYELGFRTPKYKTILKIAKALNVPAETFLFAKGYIYCTQENGISERIKNTRFSKEMSVKELAEMCGISETEMDYYEFGAREHKISKPLFSKIADSLGVSETYLIFGTEEPKDETTTEERIDKFFYELREKANSPVSTLTQSEIDSLRVIIREYLFLNNLGRQKVYERIEELKELAKYTKKEE